MSALAEGASESGGTSANESKRLRKNRNNSYLDNQTPFFPAGEGRSTLG